MTSDNGLDMKMWHIHTMEHSASIKENEMKAIKENGYN